MKPKRSSYEIMWDILTYCREPRKLTHIIQACNLNTKAAKKYVNLLMEKGLLARHGGEYVTTGKGYAYMELFTKLYMKIFSD